MAGARTDDAAAGPPIAAWREQILSAVLWSLAVLSSLAYIAGVGAAIAADDIAIIALDTVLFALLWVLVLTPLTYRVRAWGLLLISNVVGLYFTTRFGPLAAGPAWLLATPLLAAILFGKRVALGHVAAMTTALVAITVFERSGILAWSGTAPIEGWLALCGSLVTLSLVLALSAAFLLDKLAATNRALEREIAERARFEARLVEAQRMEAIGRLAGGVAHDFNNLMTANLAYTTFAIESLPDGHQARDDLDQAVATIERCQSLTSELLAFSRQEPTAPKLIRPRLVVDRLVPRLEAAAGDGVTLAVGGLAETAAIRLDPLALERVLLNLLTNARDAMPEGGDVTIDVRDRVFDAEQVLDHGQIAPAGDYVAISVSDTGVGMTEEVKRSLFEPFFTTKPVGHGTGLGLASSFGIVAQAGGFIAVDSEPGRGARFEMLFPRAAAGHAPTVLVVVNSDEVRAVVTRILRDAGYRVFESQDSAGARDQLERAAPAVELLVVDVDRPELETLCADHPAIAALRLSGHPRDRGDHLLTKPFSTEDLVTAARRALASALSS